MGLLFSPYTANGRKGCQNWQRNPLDPDHCSKERNHGHFFFRPKASSDLPAPPLQGSPSLPHAGAATPPLTSTAPPALPSSDPPEEALRPAPDLEAIILEKVGPDRPRGRGWTPGPRFREVAGLPGGAFPRCRPAAFRCMRGRVARRRDSVLEFAFRPSRTTRGPVRGQMVAGVKGLG